MFVLTLVLEPERKFERSDFFVSSLIYRTYLSSFVRLSRLLT